jgi:hypothetical protein
MNAGNRSVVDNKVNEEEKEKKHSQVSTEQRAIEEDKKGELYYNQPAQPGFLKFEEKEKVQTILV